MYLAINKAFEIASHEILLANLKEIGLAKNKNIVSKKSLRRLLANIMKNSRDSGLGQYPETTG